MNNNNFKNYLCFGTAKKPILLALSAGICCLCAALIAELFLLLFMSDTQQSSQSPSQNICLTIDVSGSMGDDKLGEVKRAAQNLISNRNEEDYIALNVFSSSAMNISPFTTDKLELNNKISELQSEGGTDFGLALDVSAQSFEEQKSRHLLKNDSYQSCAILLFTDGEPYAGNIFDTFRSKRHAIEIAKQLRRKGVVILAVATQDANFEFLKKITGDSARVIATNNDKIYEAFQQADKMISSQLMQTSGAPESFLVALIRVSGWSCFLSIGIAIGIVGMQNLFLKKNFITKEQIIHLILFGFLAGSVAGILGQLLFSSVSYFSSSLLIGFVRIVSWGILGMTMAYIMVWYVPNLSKRWAWRGGAIGGSLGAIAFLYFAASFNSLGVMGDVCGRLSGAFILGVCIGFMVGVIEKVCREAWLTVIYSPKRFSQVNVGETPVTVGSGTHDTIQSPDLAVSAAEFSMNNGMFQMKQDGVTRHIQPGDMVKIGKLKVVLCDAEHPFSTGAKIGGSEDESTIPSNRSNSDFIHSSPVQPNTSNQSRTNSFLQSRSNIPEQTHPVNNKTTSEFGSKSEKKSQQTDATVTKKTLKLPPRRP